MTIHQSHNSCTTPRLMVQKSLTLGGSSNISQKRSSPVNTSPSSRPMTKCKRRRIAEYGHFIVCVIVCMLQYKSSPTFTLNFENKL